MNLRVISQIDVLFATCMRVCWTHIRRDTRRKGVTDKNVKVKLLTQGEYKGKAIYDGASRILQLLPLLPFKYILTET